MLQVAVEQEVENYWAEFITVGVHAKRMAGATVMSQER